jgi:16S rRNA processing protein RimM
MQENANPIIVGRIGGVYGVRGWLKVESHTRPKENIFTYSPWLIHIDLEWKEVQIEKFQQLGNGRLLLKIKGINTPEKAKEYVSCKLAVTQEKLPILTEGEYYWHDLIGLEVFNQDQINLGKIKNIVETGANDVLVINKIGENKIKTLIPLIMGVYVKRVDLINKKICVDWFIEK